ncbi:MAG: M1 family aminopeptidase [Candidatus Angelobacter sp.]
MSRHLVASLIALCFVGAAAAQTLETRPAQPATTPSAPRALANNESTYLKLRNIKLGQEIVHVKDFTLTREAGIFTFRNGMFQFVEPVNGKITGAVFLGDASFALNPPVDVERRNLAILTKGQPFDEQFTHAVFRFTDGSEEEIRKAAVANATSEAGDAAGLLNDIQQKLKKKLRDNLSARLLEDVLSSQPGGKFTAFIKGKKYSDKIVYDVDSHGSPLVSPEEVSLQVWDDDHAGIWAGFHLAKEYANGTANSDEQNKTVAVQRQKLDTSIAKNAHITGTAQTTFITLQDGVRVVPLDLFPTLRVDSVIGKDGEQLAFIQEDKDEDPDFAVVLPRELKKGESYSITTKYGGKDAIRSEGSGNYYPVARENWYPGQGFGSYAIYEMTFHVPKGMTMVATGKLLKKIDEGNETITEWTSEFPQSVAGFNFGKFKREEGKPLKQPYLLETFANPDPPDFVAGLKALDDGPGVAPGQGITNTMGNMSTVGLMKKAMGEAQFSVEIYTDFFGEAPYKRLAMTQQTATNYGQSWPGLVYLPITYFFDTTVRHQIGMGDAAGYFKVVGPHEIAHQWWGHMVGFNSYRDQWMSEGFSDMSASLFLQYIYGTKNLDEYHKFWADERKILTDKNKEGRRAIDIGPVTMGYRLDNARTGFDTGRRLLYPKGAFILQMVRFMMAARAADPDVQFKAMMHDFTKTYANRQASTEDFKAVLEKYMTPDMDLGHNHKMDWFFDEFVYGTDYPSYKFEHSFSNDANGDVVLNFKLTQADVGKDFLMLVPIYLDMGNGKIARLGFARMAGSNSIEQHVPLKGLKEKPKRAMVAYYDDLLGNVENR